MGLLDSEEGEVISLGVGRPGAGLTCPLHLYMEVMGYELRGARNAPVLFIRDLAPSTGHREYCQRKERTKE